MKIGIVWENGVSKWMSQMFEPVMEMPGAEVNVFVGDRNKFDVSGVKLGKIRLTHREEILLGIAGLPGTLRRAFNNPHKKMDFYINSLNKYLTGYDVVECHDSSRSLYTLSELKRRGKGFKLVVSYAENIPYRQVFDEKTNCIKHASYDMIDHFIPWCDSVKKAMLLEGVPEEKMTTVYTGLDLDLFRPEPKSPALLTELGLDEKDFIILYIGKLVSWKGVHILPYAAKALLAMGIKDFRVVIGGKGAQLDNLKRVIAEAGIKERFRFAGFMPYERMRSLYNISDVIVVPSLPTMTWQEQFGMVLVEAMACGRPVIGSKSGAIPEVIGDAGMTFTPGEYPELTDRLVHLMRNRGLAKTLGERARRRAEAEFDARKNAVKIYEVYKKTLNGKDRCT